MMAKFVLKPRETHEFTGEKIVEAKIYRFDELLATRSFKSEGQNSYLASQSTHVGETPEI